MGNLSSFYTLDNIAACTSGRLEGGTPDLSFRDICVDSRKCTGRTLYVPIYGERVDGHLFFKNAFESGAVAALVAESFWKANGNILKNECKGMGFVVVADPLKALQDTAGLFRERHLGDVVRIGITGSSGKTTMKELLGGILKEYRPTSMNPGNLNSDIGLPMAVLSLKASDTFSVLEMGMNRKGEMDILSDIYRPNVAMVTNIGTAHIGILGSIENIAREKQKIFRYLDSSGAAFIWEDEPMFSFLVKDLKAPVFSYGRNSTPDFQEARDQGLGGWLLKIGGRMVEFPLVGEHNLLNALGAAAAARYLGAGLDEIIQGLSGVVPLFGRGEIIEGPVTMMIDCYNANPESFFAGIDTFQGLPWDGRKVLVAGSMGELGLESEPAHKALGKKAAESTFNNVFFFGEESRPAYEVFCEKRSGAGFWFDDYDLLEQSVVRFLESGDIVYIKGSRLLELERLVKPIGGLNV